MTREDLAIAIGGALFVAFLFGWIAHWLWRLAAAASSPRSDRADEMVAELMVVESARKRLEAEKRELEAALRGEAAEAEALLQNILREREAELEAAMDGLRNARAEIAELKSGA